MSLRPDSPFELIDFPRDRYTFPFAGWEAEFGVYQWFYVSGVRNLLTYARLTNRSLIYGFKDEAIRSVPKSWREVFWIGDWGDVAKLQVSRILSGMPVRFDKACLSLLCIEHAVHGMPWRDSNLNPYNHVKLSPAFFVVDGLESAIGSLSTRALIRDAAEHIGQSMQFVERSARYRLPMTYRSASKLVEFLSEKGYHQCEVRMLSTRSDRGRIPVKSPNAEESVI